MAWGRPRSSPGLRPASAGRRWGAFPVKGLFVCYFLAKFLKQQVLGAHKATVLKPHPKAFPWKSSSVKCINKLKVPFYYSVGEMYRALCIHMLTPTKLLLQWAVFSYKRKFWEKSQRCFSLVLCIYIKKQSFVCFYYFNYCYKKPAIFNMWFGGIFVCLFSCLGVLFVFLLLFFWAKKLAFSVCTAAGQDIKILKCF